MTKVTAKDVLDRIDHWFPNMPLSKQAWYEEHYHPSLGGTAKELVDAGKGQAVLNFITAIDLGTYV